MPKFVTFEKKDEDKKTILRLEDDGDGECRIVAVDEDGDSVSGGNLILFKRDGTIQRCTSVNDGLGFKLDGNERIEVN
jgi:hypothetical protein